jgi:methylated-DNA-[protein]-cysteine S-methyltransferase
MDTPMTALDGPTANHAAASSAHPAPPGKQDAAWAAEAAARRVGPGQGSSVAFVDAAPAARASGGRRRSGSSVGERSMPATPGNQVAPAAGHHQPDPPTDDWQASPPGTTSKDVTSYSAAAAIDTAPSPLRMHPIGIIADALKPNVDPCDVACEAMPAHLIGDLTPPEDAWLISHTTECDDCRTVLDRYHRIDNLLDTVDRSLEPLPTPPPFRPPAPRPAPDRRVAPAVAKRRASYGTLESPVGPLRIAVTEAGVCEIGFAINENEADFRQRLEERGFAPEPCLECDLGPEAIARVTRQLEEYFSGRRDEFDVPLDFAGISPFTQSVLAATAAIPFGHLATYRDIAEQIGAPRATRAVGNALGRNPIPVIVPCHRIVRSDATIGGYTGGLGIKKRLLALEGIAAPN